MAAELALIPGAELAWQSWDYDDFVRAGQEVASRSAWLYGDLACAVETRYGENTLARYAADIGVEYNSLREYRRVAAAFPPENATRVAFSVCREFAAQPDRLQLVAAGDWTVAQARELVASRRAPLPAPPARLPFPASGVPEPPQTDDDAGELDWPDPGEDEEPAEEPSAVPQSGAHVGHNSGDNEWYTPDEYTKAATAVMGAIDLDPASSAVANARVGATRFYSEDDDGLSRPWAGRVWMNPPYAQPLISHFCERLANEFAAGPVTEACVLVNNATETRWFHALAAVASAMCFPRGRVKFWHPDKESIPLQGQAVVYLGRNVARFRAEFEQFGFVVTL